MAKQQQYPLRFDPEERAAWQRAADRAGLPLSQWIRAACNVAAGYPREPKQADRPVICQHRRKRPGTSGLLKCQDCGEVVT